MINMNFYWFLTLVVIIVLSHLAIRPSNHTFRMMVAGPVLYLIVGFVQKYYDLLTGFFRGKIIAIQLLGMLLIALILAILSYYLLKLILPVLVPELWKDKSKDKNLDFLKSYTYPLFFLLIWAVLTSVVHYLLFSPLLLQKSFQWLKEDEVYLWFMRVYIFILLSLTFYNLILRWLDILSFIRGQIFRLKGYYWRVVNRNKNPEIKIVLQNLKKVKLLGAGGAGAVYLVQDKETKLNYAAKEMLATTADQSGYIRFRNEAMALSQLNHKNIIRVYDFKRWEDSTYLFMEYVEGGNLTDLYEITRPTEKKSSHCLG